MKTIRSTNSSGITNILYESWQNKAILNALFKRALKVKYANTLLGLIWAIVQPITYIVLLVLVFNKIAKLDTESVNPVLYSSVGLIVWIFINNCISNTATSIGQLQQLFKKIYIPKLYLPIVAMLEAFIDFIIILIIAFILSIYYVGVSFDYLFLLIAIVHLFMLGIAISMWVTMIVSWFSDLKYIIPFIQKISLFITPIAYSINSVEPPKIYVFLLNPLTGIIELFRRSLCSTSIDYTALVVSFIITFFLLIFAFLLFRKFEKTIGDII